MIPLILILLINIKVYRFVKQKKLTPLFVKFLSSYLLRSLTDNLDYYQSLERRESIRIQQEECINYFIYFPLQSDNSCKLFIDVSEIPAKTRGAHFNVERLLRYPDPFVSLFEVGMIIALSQPSQAQSQIKKGRMGFC